MSEINVHDDNDVMIKRGRLIRQFVGFRVRYINSFNSFIQDDDDIAVSK